MPGGSGKVKAGRVWEGSRLKYFWDAYSIREKWPFNLWKRQDKGFNVLYGRDKFHNSLWSSIVKNNFILSVEVSTPVTDLNWAIETEHLQNWLVMVVMYKHRLLVLCDEITVRTRWNILIGSVGDCRTGFGNGILGREGSDILRCAVRDNARRKSSVETVQYLSNTSQKRKESLEFRPLH